jgi:serine/threonine protein kinase
VARVFALKQVADKRERATRSDEGELLHAMSGHPLITRLYATFVDSSGEGGPCLCYLLELISGGELAGLMERAMVERAAAEQARGAPLPSLFSGLPPSSVRFYGACVVLMLEALHERRILYRDVKPENLLSDR